MNAEDPSFSPDGRRIAYGQRDSRSRKLRVVDIESGADVIIADSVEPFGDQAASWSPDGQRLAFCRRTERNTDSIAVWTISADGTGLRRLTPVGQQDMQPQWSPDGLRILCSSGARASDRELVVMNTDGSERRFLTDTEVIVNDSPHWSPDGTRIVYRTYGSAPQTRAVKLIDLGSGSIQLLVNNITALPYWDLSRP